MIIVIWILLWLLKSVNVETFRLFPVNDGFEVAGNDKESSRKDIRVRPGGVGSAISYKRYFLVINDLKKAYVQRCGGGSARSKIRVRLFWTIPVNLCSFLKNHSRNISFSLHHLHPTPLQVGQINFMVITISLVDNIVSPSANLAMHSMPQVFIPSWGGSGGVYRVGGRVLTKIGWKCTSKF